METFVEHAIAMAKQSEKFNEARETAVHILRDKGESRAGALKIMRNIYRQCDDSFSVPPELQVAAIQSAYKM